MGFPTVQILPHGVAVPIPAEVRAALRDRPAALAVLEACNGVTFVPSAPMSEWSFSRGSCSMGYEEPNDWVAMWADWLRRRLTVVGRLARDGAWLCVDEDGGCFVVSMHGEGACWRGPGSWADTVVAVMNGELLRPVLAPGEDSIVYGDREYRAGDPFLYVP
jgi:hypothetical protein